jgi:hypothetical protein
VVVEWQVDTRETRALVSRNSRLSVVWDPFGSGSTTSLNARPGYRALGFSDRESNQPGSWRLTGAQLATVGYPLPPSNQCLVLTPFGTVPRGSPSHPEFHNSSTITHERGYSAPPLSRSRVTNRKLLIRRLDLQTQLPLKGLDRLGTRREF